MLSTSFSSHLPHIMTKTLCHFHFSDDRRPDLPYGGGLSPHLGHLVRAVKANISVLSEHVCVCALVRRSVSDAKHGRLATRLTNCVQEPSTSCLFVPYHARKLGLTVPISSILLILNTLHLAFTLASVNPLIIHVSSGLGTLTRIAAAAGDARPSERERPDRVRGTVSSRV